MLTQAIALECADDGIRCNSVHPGIIDTPIYKTAEYAGPTPQTLAFARAPLKRAGAPEEIADGVLYLESSQSSYVTGQHVVIDGGALATSVTSQHYPPSRSSAVFEAP
jgi:NAD(P)-dependent dehydrogenase (short-subunit alcohol dehydrogenase family)